MRFDDPHDFENGYDEKYEHFHGCHKPEPGRRTRPEWAGEASTKPVGHFWDTEKPKPKIDCGYMLPPITPVPGTSAEEQMERVYAKVNELIHKQNEYTEKVYGAYDEIVHSAICNDAYYNEIVTEENYLPEAGATYKVTHIPFVDRAGQPIFLQLGLAFDNTGVTGTPEPSSHASERFLADKLVPATNVPDAQAIADEADTYATLSVWKTAPIPLTDTSLPYVMGVTDSGFIKYYAKPKASEPVNTIDTQMHNDHIVNAMDVQGILVLDGTATPDMYASNKDSQVTRTAIGMNYVTKERFIVVATHVTSEQLANILVGFKCTIAVETANDDNATVMDKGVYQYIPESFSATTTPTAPQTRAFWYITKRRFYKNEYVEDVARLTQRTGQSLYENFLTLKAVDSIKEFAKELDRRLTQEVKDREDGDKALNDRVDKEIEDRTAEIARVDGRIDTEIADRKAEDEKLDNRITAEVQTLNSRIDTEVKTLNDRITAEVNTLNQTITTLDTRLTAADVVAVEKTSEGALNQYRLKLHDSTYLEVPVETYDYAQLVLKLQHFAEVEQQLNAEIEARKKADDAEAAARLAADTVLQGNIDAEKSARIAADEAEKNAREQADSNLTDTINNEATLRANADKALETSIGNVKSQLESYINQTDATLSEIQTDIQNLQAKDEQLQTDLTSATNTLNTLKKDYETFKQTSTDDITSLKSITSTLRSDVTALQTSVNTLTEKTAALDTTVTSIQNSFNSLEISFESVKQTVQDLVDKVNNLGDVFLKLDGTSTPTADITMGSHKVTNVASPTDNADAVNKEYVDGKVDSVIEKVDGLDGNYLRLDGTNSPTADIDWNSVALYNAQIKSSSFFAEGVVEDESKDTPFTLEMNHTDEYGNFALFWITLSREVGDNVFEESEYWIDSEGFNMKFSQLYSKTGEVLQTTVEQFENSYYMGVQISTTGKVGSGIIIGQALSYDTKLSIRNTITGIDTPVNALDVANKTYVDSLAPTAMTDTEVSEITALFA